MRTDRKVSHANVRCRRDRARPYGQRGARRVAEGRGRCVGFRPDWPRCMAALQRPFSTAAWALPSNRCSEKALAVRRSSSRFRSSEPSRLRRVGSEQKVKSSTAAAVSVRQKAASLMPRVDCSRMVRRRASFSRANAVPSAMSARGSKPEIRTGQWHGGSTHHSRRINR